MVGLDVADLVLVGLGVQVKVAVGGTGVLVGSGVSVGRGVGVADGVGDWYQREVGLGVWVGGKIGEGVTNISGG